MYRLNNTRPPELQQSDQIGSVRIRRVARRNRWTKTTIDTARDIQLRLTKPTRQLEHAKQRRKTQEHTRQFRGFIEEAVLG